MGRLSVLGSIWITIVLSGACFGNEMPSSNDHNDQEEADKSSQEILDLSTGKADEIEKAEQTDAGLKIELQLKSTKILRENIITALGKLLFGDPQIKLQQNEVEALFKLHQNIDFRHYSFENLLKLLHKLENDKTKENFKILFQHLKETLPKYDQKFANICLEAVQQERWIFDNVQFNLLSNVPAEVPKSLPTEECTDGEEFVVYCIPKLLSNNEIMSTSDLMAGILVHLPMSYKTPEVSYAEAKVYDYLVSAHERAKVVNRTVKYSGSLIAFVLDQLSLIPNISEEVKNSAKTLRPVLAVGPLKTSSWSKVDVEAMRTILANNSINFKVLFKLIDKDFPADIVRARKQLVSLQRMNVIEIPKVFKDFNYYQYRNPEDLLLAVLNKLQRTNTPKNLAGLIDALYIHAKVLFENAAQIPRFLSSDLQVGQLLSAYSNNHKNQKLIQTMNTFKSHLLRKNIDWVTFSADFYYNNNNCKAARKCLYHLLTEIKQSNLSAFQTMEIQNTLQAYFQIVDENGVIKIQQNQRRVFDGETLKEFNRNPTYKEMQSTFTPKLFNVEKNKQYEPVNDLDRYPAYKGMHSTFTFPERDQQYDQTPKFCKHQQENSLAEYIQRNAVPQFNLESYLQNFHQPHYPQQLQLAINKHQYPHFNIPQYEIEFNRQKLPELTNRWLPYQSHYLQPVQPAKYSHQYPQFRRQFNIPQFGIGSNRQRLHEPTCRWLTDVQNNYLAHLGWNNIGKSLRFQPDAYFQDY